MANSDHRIEHEFVLVLTGISSLSEAMEDALYQAGCNDATISVRQGRVTMRFSRAGVTARDAIESATLDVRKANIGADVLRVEFSNYVNED